MEREVEEEFEVSQSRLLVVQMGRDKARYHKPLNWSPTIVSENVKSYGCHAGQHFYKWAPAGT